MPYVPTVWVNESAPDISAENLNHLEEGAATAQDTADAAQTAADAISWTALPGKPAVVAAGVDQAAARIAIGAGDGTYAGLSGKPTLGTAAAQNIGAFDAAGAATTAAAAAQAGAIAASAQRAANLSDLVSAATARNNLGIPALLTKLYAGKFYVADYASMADDVALTACLADAITDAINSGTFAPHVVLEPRLYDGGTTLKHGDPTWGGNALFGPLPYIDPGVVDQKVNLTISCDRDASSLLHWLQSHPQKSGCVLYTAGTGFTPDGTYGVPSILGGPTKLGNGVFSNMLVTLQGISVMAPFNPSLIGIDLNQAAQARVLNGSALAEATVGGAGGFPNIHTIPTNDLGMGLRMPRNGNNDQSFIGSWSCEGFFYGMSCGDHLAAQRVALIYCDTGIYVYGSGAREHGNSFLNLSIEACNWCFEFGGGAPGGRIPIDVVSLHTEGTAGTIKDPNNGFVGTVNYQDNLGAPPSNSGAGRLRIIDQSVDRGVATTTVPVTQNTDSTLVYRDRQIIPAGGTVTGYKVGGVSIGTPSSFFVPTGQPWQWAGSGAPTAQEIRL